MADLYIVFEDITVKRDQRLGKCKKLRVERNELNRTINLLGFKMSIKEQILWRINVKIYNNFVDHVDHFYR